MLLRTYAMQAVSSPKMCTCGFRMVVLIALLLLPSTFSKLNLWKSMPSIRLPSASGSNEVRCGSHIFVYVSKSPLLIASISCSVILMISCRRALQSSSSTVVLDESVDSFTCEPSPFFAIMLLLEKLRVASIVVRMAPFSLRRALNFFKQSTVSCRCTTEATRSR
uniref:Uncharacterized protein n=1 Tax=Anopheles atroparvus TaxID=41427 RepID=A0A182ITT4_ANOAO